MKEKLKLKIGYKHDRFGNKLYDELGNPIPIYKTIKKLKVMYLSQNKEVSFHWVKPFKQGDFWYYELKDNTYVIPDTENMIMWTPKIGETPIVITKWMDVESLREPKCDWIEEHLEG